jgi:hypothetical protein
LRIKEQETRLTLHEHDDDDDDDDDSLLLHKYSSLYIANLRQVCHNSKFGFFSFLVIGIERNFCRCTSNGYSVITQFAKLAAGEQLCRRCTRRKL